MFPVDPDHSFTQRLADLGNINTCLRLLSAGDQVREIFPEPPSLHHLLIVVWRPDMVLLAELLGVIASRVGQLFFRVPFYLRTSFNELISVILC